MDIVHPEKSTYATDAAKKHMSFSREMSLKRSVSRRVVLVKKDGALADTQYTDQYVDKGRVRAELKKQMSCVSFGGLLAADGGGSGVSAFQRSLSKCAPCAAACVLALCFAFREPLTSTARWHRNLRHGSVSPRSSWCVAVLVRVLTRRCECRSLSCAPTRGLATSLSRAASRAGSATGGAGRSTFGGGKIAGPEDRGMGRAVGHVMSSARAASMSPARPGQPASAGWIMQPSAGCVTPQPTA